MSNMLMTPCSMQLTESRHADYSQGILIMYVTPVIIINHVVNQITKFVVNEDV